MGYLNKVLLIGNIGREPEVRYTKDGVPVATFSLATNEFYRDKNGEKAVRTEWHRIVVWRNLAEWCAQYLNKGRQILVEGKLRTREFEDTSGTKRRVTEIVAVKIQLLGSPGTQPQTPEEASADEEPPPDEPIDSEDVPF